MVLGKETNYGGITFVNVKILDDQLKEKTQDLEDRLEKLEAIVVARNPDRRYRSPWD